jgi:hypothetical protein
LTESSIIEEITLLYRVSKETAAEDVREFLRELEGERLLHNVADGSRNLNTLSS